MDKRQWHKFKKPIPAASHFIRLRKEHRNSMSHFISLSSSLSAECSPLLQDLHEWPTLRWWEPALLCWLRAFSIALLTLTPSGHHRTSKAGVGQPSFPLSFRLQPYNKPARRAIVDQRSASPSDNPPQPCQLRPLILTLVSTSIPACRPHPCSIPGWDGFRGVCCTRFRSLLCGLMNKLAASLGPQKSMVWIVSKITCKDVISAPYAVITLRITFYAQAIGKTNWQRNNYSVSDTQGK